MKKTLFSLLLLPVLLSSCGRKDSVSPTTPSLPVSPSSPAPASPSPSTSSLLPLDEAEILARFSDLARLSYRAQFRSTVTHADGESETTTETFLSTPTYYLEQFGSLASGVVLLPGRDGKNLVRNIEKNPDGVRILSNATDGKGTPKTTLEDYNVFLSLSKLSSVVFEPAGEESFVTKNGTVVAALAGMVGYSQEVQLGAITQVTFLQDDQGQLIAHLDGETTVDGTKVMVAYQKNQIVFSDVGSASDVDIEEARASFSISSDKIPDAAVDFLSGETGTFQSRIYESESKTAESEAVETLILGVDYRYDLTNQKRLFETIDEKGNKISSLLYVGTDKGVEARYLDATNTVRSADASSQPLNALIKKPGSLFTADDFRKIGTEEGMDVYRYEGYQAFSLAYSLLPYNEEVLWTGTLGEIDFYVENGKARKATVAFGSLNWAQPWHLRFETDLSSDAIINEPTPYTESDPDIQAAMDRLSGTDAVYKASMSVQDFTGDAPFQYTYYSLKDTVLFMDSNQTGTGYTRKDGKIYPIQVNRDKTVKVTGEPKEGDTLYDHRFITADARALEKATAPDPDDPKKTNTILVGKAGVYDVLDAFLVDSFNKGAGSTTNYQIVLEDGKITKEIYNYQDSMTGVSGITTVAFSYDGVALDPTVQAAIDNLETTVKKNSSWAEETRVYGLSENFTESDIPQIPYLYDADFSGHWRGYGTYDASYPYYGVTLILEANDDKSFVPTEEQINRFVSAYKALLAEKGYTLDAGTENSYTNESKKWTIEIEATTKSITLTITNNGDHPESSGGWEYGDY
jgi:hypothetical protein